MSVKDCDLFTLTICLLNIACTANAIELGCWHWGRCPYIDVQQDFSVSQYTGKWYEQAGYNTWSVEGNVRCSSANYILNQTENILLVENRGISNYTNKWTGINGTALVNDPSKHEGKLTVVFHLGWWTVTGDYWVLGTDYDSYTVVYTCTNHLLLFHEYTIWFLGRDQNFSSSDEEQSYYNATNDVLKAHGLDPALMKRSSQSNCDVSDD